MTRWASRWAHAVLSLASSTSVGYLTGQRPPVHTQETHNHAHGAIQAPMAEHVFWLDHQPAVARFFPSPESLRWFLRQHREDLVAHGAMCFIAGRMYLSPSAFDAAVVAVGQRLAAGK